MGRGRKAAAELPTSTTCERGGSPLPSSGTQLPFIIITYLHYYSCIHYSFSQSRQKDVHVSVIDGEPVFGQSTHSTSGFCNPKNPLDASTSLWPITTPAPNESAFSVLTSRQTLARLVTAKETSLHSESIVTRSLIVAVLIAPRHFGAPRHEPNN